MLISLSGHLERGRLSRHLESLRRLLGRSGIENLTLEGVQGSYRRGIGESMQSWKNSGSRGTDMGTNARVRMGDLKTSSLTGTGFPLGSREERLV